MGEWKRAIRSAAILHLWQVYGITYEPIVEIVTELALDRSLRYLEALEDWAKAKAERDAFAWPSTRWHSEICYRLLKVEANVEGGAAAWIEARAKEVRAIADGIPA